jgi:hypothetical protein
LLLSEIDIPHAEIDIPHAEIGVPPAEIQVPPAEIGVPPAEFRLLVNEVFIEPAGAQYETTNTEILNFQSWNE